MFMLTSALWMTERFAGEEKSRSQAGGPAITPVNAPPEKPAEPRNDEMITREKQAQEEILPKETIIEQNNDPVLEHEQWFEPDRRALLPEEDEEQDQSESEDDLPLRSYLTAERAENEQEEVSASVDDQSEQTTNPTEADEKRRGLLARLEEESSREHD
ncbi:hypothetical protein [Salisediminibacterium halotolerans]|uniref:hypothetical protein n=1 Tax=Salisediminibacterium halotolerans TaxID=517425 RepID=UPI00115FCFF2|nr:hypothetical protein [Salisediminibacterium haloalkalitolerans]